MTCIDEYTYENNIEVLRKITYSARNYEILIMDEDGVIEMKFYRNDDTLSRRDIYNDDGSITTEYYDSNGNLIVDDEP